MMFMTPYTRRHTDMGSFNPFRDLAELERSFFGEDSLAAFRTDIQDTGDAYVLEADLLEAVRCIEEELPAAA